MKAFYYGDDLGKDVIEARYPRPTCAAEAEQHRDAMLEAVAEMDDDLTHEVPRGRGADRSAEIKRGLRLGTLAEPASCPC